jgi:hypothetical protein
MLGGKWRIDLARVEHHGERAAHLAASLEAVISSRMSKRSSVSLRMEDVRPARIGNRCTFPVIVFRFDGSYT